MILYWTSSLLGLPKGAADVFTGYSRQNSSVPWVSGSVMDQGGSWVSGSGWVMGQ